MCLTKEIFMSSMDYSQVLSLLANSRKKKIGSLSLAKKFNKELKNIARNK